MRIIRAQLEGPDAELGRVAASDVARMIIGLERAIARAAYLVLGQERRGTGRHRQAIESASRLRFVEVSRGSVVSVLALPDTGEPSSEELPISVADLSSMAVRRLMDALTGEVPASDSELAAAVAQLATELGIGDRNSALTLVDETEADAPPRRAIVDIAVRDRMQRLSVGSAWLRDDTLVGVLVEADFEQHTARLRLADGQGVSVSFPVDLADDIQEALRSRARFDGLIHYDPRSSQARRVELRTVVRSTQLPLEGESFWHPQSFADLQASQGTTGRVDPADLAIEELTDDERAAFLAALDA
jgi:hypothetical protein